MMRIVEASNFLCIAGRGAAQLRQLYSLLLLRFSCMGKLRDDTFNESLQFRGHKVNATLVHRPRKRFNLRGRLTEIRYATFKTPIFQPR